MVEDGSYIHIQIGHIERNIINLHLISSYAWHQPLFRPPWHMCIWSSSERLSTFFFFCYRIILFLLSYINVRRNGNICKTRTVIATCSNLFLTLFHFPTMVSKIISGRILSICLPFLFLYSYNLTSHNFTSLNLTSLKDCLNQKENTE